MERLTNKFDDGRVGVIKCFDQEELIDISDCIEDDILNASIQSAADRLAEYEDTGMTPEDAIKWKNDAIEATAEAGEMKIRIMKLIVGYEK